MDHTTLIMAQLSDLFRYWGTNVRSFGNGDQLLAAIDEAAPLLTTSSPSSSHRPIAAATATSSPVPPSLPSLLLLPLQGPIDGIQMARLIHNRIPKYRLPIVLLCALAERKQEHKADIDAFASLPLKPGELWKASIEAIETAASFESSLLPSSSTSSSSSSPAVSPATNLRTVKTPSKATGISSRAVVRPLNILVAEDNPINQKVNYLVCLFVVMRV
jgi:CheY-like chemotaxis protein